MMMNNFHVIPNVLSNDDIDLLINYWNSIDNVVNIKNNKWDTCNKVITNINLRNRKVRITGIRENQFSNITNKIKTSCEHYLNTECVLEFPHYLTEYTVGSYHKTHIDGFKYKQRDKVVGVQLTDSDNYIGGDLIINNEVAPRTKGSLIIYNGSVPHEVTEVTKGTRYSLTECLVIKKTNHLI